MRYEKRPQAASTGLLQVLKSHPAHYVVPPPRFTPDLLFSASSHAQFSLLNPFWIDPVLGENTFAFAAFFSFQVTIVH